MTPLDFILIPLITGVTASLSLSGKLLSSLLSESAPQFSPERPSCCPSCTGRPFLTFCWMKPFVQDKTGRPACSVWPFFLGWPRPSLFLPSSSCLFVNFIQALPFRVPICCWLWKLTPPAGHWAKTIFSPSKLSPPSFYCCLSSSYFPTQVFMSFVQSLRTLSLSLSVSWY